MPGFAHIFGVGTVSDSAGINIPQYQFTYNDGESSYARIFHESQLIEFLREELTLYPDTLNHALSELRSNGNTILHDIEISRQDTAAMGLQQVVTDN
jgi:hypothetical protein